MTHTPTVQIIGRGRAGGSFALALAAVGWRVRESLGRDDDMSGAAADVDLVLICAPDAAVATVARAIAPGRAVVAHVAGSLGLRELAPHRRVAACHPLLSLPDATTGAERLRSGWFAVAGDPIASELVTALGGRSFEVADQHRATYHAAACVASNHVVALLGQVERLAELVGVPAEAYWHLTEGSVANVAAMGAGAALTGPAARGDDATIERHLSALPDVERPSYAVMVTEARRLAREHRVDDR